LLDRRKFLAAGAASVCLGRSRAARAAPGVTDKAIRIGQTMPYSGPASAYGVIGRVEAAYFEAVNEQGGINGRRIEWLSLDDGYNPARTVEQVRRLVEQEKVALLFNQLGVGPCLATRDYLNQKGVPQLFVASGAAAFADPAHYKWTIPFQPNYRTEASIFARHILATRADAKVAILYQNDDFGRDYLIGLEAALGERASQIVGRASYETSAPSVDSQVATLQGSGADVFVIAATPKFAAQAIRHSFDLDWQATRYVADVSLSVASVLKAAGLEKAKGLITASYRKEGGDPRWKDDAGFLQYKAFVEQRLSAKDLVDSNAVYGFNAAILLTHVLQACGDDLSRDSILSQATNLRDLSLPMLLPGVTVDTSTSNYDSVRRMQLQRFDGTNWELFGEPIRG
jgi:branched-chain amino acid transport system substrate-binding protein